VEYSRDSAGNEEMDNEAHGWELIYRSTSTYDRAIPHEDAENLHRLYQENGVRRVLDLGCGDGRHLHYFSNLGYEMYGIDYAPSALYLANVWLTADNLSAELVCADMTSIPWRDELFDAAISFLVINHNPAERIRQTIAEIHRVLKSDGWLFVAISTCKPIGPMRYNSGIEIEPDTIVLTEGREKGVPHHFFTTPELIEMFSRFTLVDLHWDSRSRACLLLGKR
jgi:SAM-dependent methyltransferase